MATLGEQVRSIADFLHGLRENSLSDGKHYGLQRHVTVPLGPPLLVDSATYIGAIFIAPCDGCEVKQLRISGALSIGSGTNTLAFDNYDASANAARNLLAATNFDPDTITAKEGLDCPLSATMSNRMMDEGDVINYTMVIGTQTTAGEGYLAHLVVTVPEIL